MAGTLFLVSTPIGNLEDITLRAIRILREVDLIAAEDTRRTAKLLNHLGISTPTLSFHEHNTRTRLPQLVQRLEAGGNVALVTDAGTPSVSDPGVMLVRSCVEAGIFVDPIPGPSAPLAVATVSGFPLDPWTIFGFPPSRSKDRSDWWSTIAGVPHTLSFFEAPHRVRATLDEASRILGDRPIVVGREVTKVHQQFLRGTASEVALRLPAPKGEFTIIVGPKAVVVEPGKPADESDLVAEFWQLAESGAQSRRSAINLVAKRHGLSARDVYAVVERHKKLLD